jgi:hypothetical protein
LSEAGLLRGADLIMRYLLAFALDRDGAKTSGGETGPGMRVAEPMTR